MLTKRHLALILVAIMQTLPSFGDSVQMPLLKACKDKWCYHTALIEGWSVYFSEDLANGDANRLENIANQVTKELSKIRSVLPESKRAKFQMIRLYVSSFDPQGRHTHCVYHYSREVLTQRGNDPDKFQNVEIANSDSYLKSRESQPAAILHEFGHAYIHRFLDESEKAKLISAYEAAMKAGSYNLVSYFNGETVSLRKAYAAT